MKKYLFVLSLSLFAILFFASCSGPKAVQEDTSKLPSALLWKVEGKGLKNPSYVFGTIHMITKEDYFLPEGFEDAFNKSDKVVFEIDLDDMSDMGSLMGLLSGLMMKDGMTIKKLLSPEEYKEVSAYFETMGLPMVLVGKVKPMFLSMLAEVNMDPNAMQSDEIISYEMELYDKANLDSKDVGGLETMAYQLSLFDSIPYKEQAEMLLDAVRGNNLESDMFDQTVALYKKQDIEGMVSMVGESEQSDDSNFEDVLLNNRNQTWIPSMIKQMTAGSTFFAVGAGHLAGEQGVLKLLKKAGYDVTPVSVYRASTPKKV